MRKQESTTANYTTKKQSIVDQFVDWFRNFIENAE
mgnify:CR=1 FL=1|tara:strand:+ start:61601 stop:61705 length:105 start_codon:yes stop_codon:yes gene_type:complete